jgi:hypothetical protein
MIDKEALKLALEALGIQLENSNGEQKYADAIKALAQPEQEPVAWMHQDKYKTYFTTDPSEDLLSNDYWIPLYTTPPQRTWVGLTDEENLICLGFSKVLGLQYQEAKLKEKNT